MLRSLFRSGVVAVFVLSLSGPAQALPLDGAHEGSTFSLATFWERLISPVVALWSGDSRAVCDPNGGGCIEEGGTSDTRAICDPNGGECGS
jgi:hypothetical protein